MQSAPTLVKWVSFIATTYSRSALELVFTGIRLTLLLGALNFNALTALRSPTLRLKMNVLDLCAVSTLSNTLGGVSRPRVVELIKKKYSTFYQTPLGAVGSAYRYDKHCVLVLYIIYFTIYHRLHTYIGKISIKVPYKAALIRQLQVQHNLYAYCQFYVA